jgi:sugar/nucleoside kinase (ribokinase family)
LSGGLTTDVLVLGDLCLDTVADVRLPFRFGGTALLEEPSAWVPLSERSGGSAFHFAVWARRHGLTAVVLGCVGQDLAGDLVLRELVDQEIVAKVARSELAPTARVVIAHDAVGVRLMMASAASANDDLSAGHVHDALRKLDRCKLLWLSGLCLRRASARRIEAASTATRLARAAGARVFLDLVPHDFVRYYESLKDVEALVGPIHGVASELSSLSPLLRWGDRGRGAIGPDLDVAVDRLLEHTEVAIVRAREGDVYRQVARSRDGFDEEWTRSVPTAHDVLGFGDDLVCKALSRFLRTAA